MIDQGNDPRPSNSQDSLERGLESGPAYRLSGTTPAARAELRGAIGAAEVAGDLSAPALRAAPGTLAAPDRDPDRAVQSMLMWDVEGGVVVHYDAGPTALVGDGRATLDPGTMGGYGYHALLLPVLSLLHQQRGECVVHAAGYLDERGAVLALGPTGRGKSTLTLAALSAGLPVLGDDLVAMRLDADGRLEVAGIPQPLSLPGDLTSAILGAAVDGDHRGRRRAAAPPQLATGWHPPSGVVLVEHSTEVDGHVESVPAGEVVREVINGSVSGLHPATVHDAFPFAVALARVPARRLGHAADPDRRIAAVQRLLEMPVRS